MVTGEPGGNGQVGDADRSGRPDANRKPQPGAAASAISDHCDMAVERAKLSEAAVSKNAFASTGWLGHGHVADEWPARHRPSAGQAYALPVVVWLVWVGISASTQSWIPPLYRRTLV